MKQKEAKKDDTFDPELIKAIEKGDLKTVRARLAAGANINATPKHEVLPIFVAIGRGHLDIVEALIAAGANVNCVAYPSRGASVKATPLSAAIDDGHWEITQALLKAGAQIGLEHFTGENAAGEAADRAISSWYKANAPEEELFKKRTKKDQQKYAEDSERWTQFVRDAVAAGVKLRDYWLWSAAKNGFTGMVNLLIAAGTNVNAAPHISSALESAIEAGHLEIVKALVSAGAALSAARENRPAPLLLAASGDHLEMVRALLDAGADINVVGDVALEEFSLDDSVVEKNEDAQGAAIGTVTHFAMPPVAEASSALIVAVRRKNANLAKLLIERGADLNLADKHGVTAFTWAARLNQNEIAGLLNQASAAAAEFAEGSGASALLAASQKGDAAAIQNLTGKGTDANGVVKDREGHHVPIVEAARTGHLDAVRALLAAGADVNAVAQEEFTGGITALMLAAEKGHPDVVSALLAAGSQPELKDFGFEGGGESAIHYAARGGNAKVIQLLLAAGVKPNAKAKGGRTPLLIAIGKRHVDAVKALLAAGANPNTGPSDGAGPLWKAADTLDVPMLRLLLKHGATPVSKAQNPGFLPLSAAAGKGSVEIVKLLLEAGAPINATTAGFSGALADAALRGHADVLAVLIEAGADVNQAWPEGFTPLMAAVRSGKQEAVELLLKAGADPNRKNKSGQTALQMAIESKTKSLVPLLEAATATSAKGEQKISRTQAKSDSELDEEEELEPPDFSAAAQTPEFKAVVTEVAALCGSAAEPLSDLAGCVSFNVPREHADKLLLEHHGHLLARGAYLFRHHRDHLGTSDKLGLLPTKNWADLITAFQTNGANCDLMPAGIIEWLKKLEKQHPFELTGGGFDWLEGRFLHPLKKARTLAQQMYKFCPDIVDQGIGSTRDLANALEKDGYFFFWWD